VNSWTFDFFFEQNFVLGKKKKEEEEEEEAAAKEIAYPWQHVLVELCTVISKKKVELCTALSTQQGNRRSFAVSTPVTNSSMHATCFENLSSLTCSSRRVCKPVSQLPNLS
jgi:hypothetical protein